MDQVETQSPCFKKLADEVECRLPEGEDNTGAKNYCVSSICWMRLHPSVDTISPGRSPFDCHLFLNVCHECTQLGRILWTL